MNENILSGRLAGQEDNRDETAADVLAGVLGERAPVGRALVVGPGGTPLLRALSPWAPSRRYWTRLCEDGQLGESWPSDGPYDAAVVRLPRGKDSLSLMLHAATSLVEPRGWIYVVGLNDEGVRSAGRILEELLDDVCTLETKRHCRVLAGIAVDPSRVRGHLAQWQREVPHPLGLGTPWLTYPGLFAGGALDDGTAELISVMPKLYGDRRCLDFGCGSGVISAHIAAQSPDVQVTAIDADAIACEATRQNAPSVQVVVGDRLEALGHRTFHRIVSNPPFHRGKMEHFGVVKALVEAAPRHLTQRGELWLVTQRQVPMQKLLEATFKDVVCAKQTGRFHVWRAR